MAPRISVHTTMNGGRQVKRKKFIKQGNTGQDKKGEKRGREKSRETNSERET